MMRPTDPTRATASLDVSQDAINPDAIDLEALERVTERLCAARADNGHCGEGHFEHRQRLNERDAAVREFQTTFTPEAVTVLLALSRRTQDAEADSVRLNHEKMDAIEAHIAAQARIRVLSDLVTEAAAKFDEYALLHYREEGDAKALTNANMAAKLRAALTSTEAEGED